MQIDWTDVIVAVIGVLATVAGYGVKILMQRYVVPWLEQKRLMAAAQIAVNAAEAMYGRYNGGDKMRFALDVLNKKGFHVDPDSITDAISAAWQELDIKQYLAGIKYVEDDPDCPPVEIE